MLKNIAADMGVLYLILLNVVTFAMYGIDKYLAVRQMWRIPEKTLLAPLAFGGGGGAALGMLVFHHKTRKSKFRTAAASSVIVYTILLASVMRIG